MKNKYVIITPVRDEIRHIKKTIESVCNQTILPAEWVIVDDGSTDGTGEFLDKYTKNINWITVLHRKNRGFRANGGGVIEAFYEGYDNLKQNSWDFIVKLDGDVSFDKNYFYNCLFYFEKNGKLGIGGGNICVYRKNRVEIEEKGLPSFHVRGAVKMYRRNCWKKISPLVKEAGWDTIDEVKANMHGWSTQTFEELIVIQNKNTGDADGLWKNYIKNGRANYITGYHPLFMIGKCIKRTLRRPFMLMPIALFIGFFSSFILRLPQVNDAKVIRYLRNQQLRKITMLKSIYG